MSHSNAELERDSNMDLISRPPIIRVERLVRRAARGRVWRFYSGRDLVLQKVIETLHCQQHSFVYIYLAFRLPDSLYLLCYAAMEDSIVRMPSMSAATTGECE